MICINLHTFENDILWFRSELSIHTFIVPLVIVAFVCVLNEDIDNSMGRFSHKSIIINRMDLPEEKQHFHPFSEHLRLHISAFCVRHVMRVYVSIPLLPTGTLQSTLLSQHALLQTGSYL